MISEWIILVYGSSEGNFTRKRYFTSIKEYKIVYTFIRNFDRLIEDLIVKVLTLFHNKNVHKID